MSTAPRAKAHRAHHRAGIVRARGPGELLRELSALIEDPVLAGDIESRELRRMAMAEVIKLRGLDPKALL